MTEADADIDNDNNRNVCFFCGVTGQEQRPLELCPHCGLVRYCSQDHFDIHRHKEKCFPFAIRRSKEKGRYMVAVRDIAPLELILREDPAAIGPYSSRRPCCLQCFSSVSGSWSCPRCHLPMCGQDCADGERHAAECAFLASVEPKVKWPHANAHLDVVTPLRMMLVRNAHPRIFERIALLSDNGPAADSPSTESVFSQLSPLSASDLARMSRVLRTNGMRLEAPHHSQGCPGVALYPVYCLINHACRNNTNYVKFPDLHLELRSQTAIKKGEEILTRYISSTIGNLRRREEIRRFWSFECFCSRCRDPTEFGTLMSAVRCLGCQNGYLQPESTLEVAPLWGCDQCGLRVAHNVVDRVVRAIEKQLISVVTADVSDLEEMLFRYHKLVHPNHYILLDIMHSLLHMYAAKEASLTRPEKERKVQLCLIVLEALGTVDPGYTTWRGSLLQELIRTLMSVSKEDHKARRISDAEFHRRLSFCSTRLEEAKLCLRGGFSAVD